jgi:thiamine pyrophosphokinase
MKNITKKILVVANGIMPGKAVVKKILLGVDLIVCADGGANHARRMNLHPDVIIGDLDSLSYTTKKLFTSVKVIFNGDRNSTDLEKAIEYCIQKKFKSITVIGVTGSRIDHTFGNIGCFKKYSRKIDIKFIDHSGELSLVKKSKTITGVSGKTVSLMPVGKCEGVTTENLLYKLKNETLELGSKEGTSNKAISDKITIKVRSGCLLLYVFHK